MAAPGRSAAVLITASLTIAAQRPTAPAVWGYGGGPEQIRYSPLKQIDRTNVKQLELAWTYDTGETGALQTQPLVVGDVLFGYTPSQKVFAVNAATGAHLWTFDAGMKSTGPNRGLMFWQKRRRAARLRGGGQLRLCARSRDRQSRSRASAPSGRIDLRENLGRDPVDAGRPADVARGDLPGPDDRWRPRRRGAADVARRRARLRRAHGRVEMVLPHHPASGRARLRDLAEAGLGVQRRRQQLARDGGRRADGDRLRADRFGGVRLLRRRSPRRQSVRQLADCARREHRQARLALSVRPARHLGSRSAVAAESRHGPQKRPDDRRRRAGDQAGAAVSLQSRARASRSIPSSTGSFRRAACPAKKRIPNSPLR